MEPPMENTGLGRNAYPATFASERKISVFIDRRKRFISPRLMSREECATTDARDPGRILIIPVADLWLADAEADRSDRTTA